MALQGARFVLGVDPSLAAIERARGLAEAHGVADRVRFVEHPGADRLHSFDVVISQNSMEHFPDPSAALRLMVSMLRNGGTLLITFSPPWYAPYGSHMQFFTRMPWVNLLFSERTVMAVRSRFRSDGATRYEDVEGGLNRMSLAKFERLVRASSLEVLHLHYQGVRRLRWPARVPLVRELLVTRVDCALRSPA
jgi:SAM-dependent methyltransferase